MDVYLFVCIKTYTLNFLIIQNLVFRTGAGSFVAARGKLNLLFKKKKTFSHVKREKIIPFPYCLDECEINNAAVCVVGYNYITLGNKYYLYWNTLNHRLPAINDILSHTSATIILNDRFKITMPTFYFTGYCLGAPVSNLI